MTRGEKAKALFEEGYNCCQAVVLSYSDILGIEEKTLSLLASGFGGGMGRMREVCGACTGAFMVLGMKYGSTSGKDAEGKKRMYEIIQKFAARFKEVNGFDSIICRDLLGLEGASVPTPAARTGEYYKKRPCPELVAMASGLLGEFMNE